MVNGKFALALWGGLVVVGLLIFFAIEVYSLRGGNHNKVVDCVARANVIAGGFIALPRHRCSRSCAVHLDSWGDDSILRLPEPSKDLWHGSSPSLRRGPFRFVC